VYGIIERTLDTGLVELIWVNCIAFQKVTCQVFFLEFALVNKVLLFKCSFNMFTIT